MKNFEFGTGIIDKVIKEINKAKKYIRIVVFQIHNKEIINKLKEKVKMGVSIELITLPYESIQENVRAEVTKELKELEKAGGKIYLCNWNLGDTSHTKTVPGPWHNLHSKFMVTDKSAIVLSANLIGNDDIDAILINDDRAEIKDFNKKFESVMEDYMQDKIFKKIKESIESEEDYSEIITPPKHLSRNQKSILHYPIKLCPNMEDIEEKLYVFPLDCKGRDFVKKIIEDSSQFVYISTERFTDKELFYFLQKEGLKNKEIKILTKFQSQDYQYEIIQFAKNCLTTGIELKDNKMVHAKLIVTDKLVALGSINLNQMNLGFEPKKGFWRSNTEVMLICKDKEIIDKAKNLFLGIFSNSDNVIKNLVKKEVDNFKKIAKEVLNMPLYNSGGYLAEKFLREEIVNRKKYLEIIKEAAKLAKAKNLKKIKEELIKEVEDNSEKQTKL
ncbi:phosphatidylserine/phosphatidylglycerophosphate/cardiolipin synthase family protein [Candidatus Pacearchaeota archaeon]|nr:phosphatidylserine/phosphatidylglycerophosphate/cardiolipin synthase family protein [Candidatus Pacearchaeota archaeon]